ncbi:FecCD family ABC transporter permease [Dermabacter jinjuensis]|uniref:Ferrichrome ABC transporter permease n=1 Tax=Dermabacter jinjuensis TaxID=1667168 RepID=A0ABM6PNL5_9MICO|nr:iron ABC transporter permease [Dermabacter jinjuensis]ATH96950.1 ferrichrome ABC transporter permease [Dermabacter jinjuensis]UEB89105.1 iron ABC transporter permease [Dermabacter jinjuensis]
MNAAPTSLAANQDRAARLAQRSRTRHVLAVVILVVALVASCAWTLAVGRLGTPITRQPQALLDLLTGRGSLALTTLRGPRLAVAVGAGAALGLAGALFQRATANPLVTPDVIGITTAAGAGMAVASALNVPTSLGALGGALAAGLIIPWATTTGFRNPGAVIVAGIGVAAASTALTQFVLVFSRQSEAMALAAALTGSLTARTWGDALVVWSVLLPLGPVALALRVDLDLISLGDDVAHGLGSRPAKTRSFALLVGILLTVGAVAAAGPLAFVALTAPHLARGLTGRPAMGSAALIGATTVCLADLAVRHVAFLAGLPVGVLTALIGGLFLGAVLISQIREGSL